ncbi:hypothetical protein OQJ13_07520 [Legionella sp. PATHC035]|uniref:hypothetical protein n=1 Tax=Legionella sp. PATHC035 TaxID=2992040 RepID=UPI0022442E8A|nr:hypothetical protein [Legionella sp. PATHC035]MCW8408818.1 hypothetical protein [Legionella sp. PATHC035]
MMGKVVYHSFDFDGCLSNEASAFALGTGWEQSKSKEQIDKAYIDANRDILKALARGDKTVLLVGSNRQDPEIDFTNGSGSAIPPGSVFPRMEAIAKELGENTTFNPFLLLDLEIEPVAIGQTYDKFKEKDYLNENGSYKSFNISRFESDGFPRQLDDESKVSLLFAQMKLAAMQNPDDEIEFNFYDDRKDIVQGLQKFFAENPELIPKNVTLNIKGYSGPQLTQEQVQNTLQSCIFHSTGSFDSEKPDPATVQAMNEARENNYPVLIRIIGEEDKFKLYRRDIDGTWGFADFESQLKLDVTMFPMDGGKKTLKNPEIAAELIKQHFLPIPSTRQSKPGQEVYDFGEPQDIATIKGVGRIPETNAITDLKSEYQALRQASRVPDSLLELNFKLSVAHDFSLTRLLAQSCSDSKISPPKGIQEFISQKFSKMSSEEIAKTLVDSKINGHSIIQILEDEQGKDEIIQLVIDAKLSRLKGDLTIKERYEIESSLKGIEAHLPHDFTKMSAEALSAALSDSEMRGQAIVKLLKDDENKEQIINLIIDRNFSKLQGELMDEERQKIEASFNGMEPFITQKFAQMQSQEIVKLLNDSHMSGQMIVQLLKDTENKEQIISDLIKIKRSKLQGVLSEKERIELESSLMELYRNRINSGLSKLSEKVEVESLNEARQALHATISETLENPDLTLEDYQHIDKTVHHANIASDLKNPKHLKSICRLGELADKVVGKKSERLSGVSAACAALAGVALIVAAVLAPTGIGLIVGLALAAAFAGASAGTGIAAKRSESDLSKKTHAFKDALEAASAGTGIAAKKSESDLSKKTHAFKDALEDMREQDEEVKDTQLGQTNIQLST